MNPKDSPSVPQPNKKIDSSFSKLMSPIRRSLKRLYFTSVDNGWFGLTPLKTHVVVCGFPRSGSTLLLLMIETCVANIKVYGQERFAMGYHAMNEFRNHSILVTKKPNDIFNVERIREYYDQQKADVRFILTIRDPRAILTSFHARIGKENYYVSPERWRKTYKSIKYASQGEDSLILRFEDLISRPLEIQSHLTKLIGWKVQVPFDQFHTKASSDFKGDALNDLRPLDKKTIQKWRDEEHKERIKMLLKEMPDLPERIIEMGYEKDESWTSDYR